MNKSYFATMFCLLLFGCFSDSSDELNMLYEDENPEVEALLKAVDTVEFAYKHQQGGMRINSIGRIVKLLDDQSNPYPAQRILIRLSSGRKLLILHNLKYAKKVPKLTVGEFIEFNGKYKWNSKGGIILFTYKNASDKSKSGFIKYRDVMYQ